MSTMQNIAIENNVTVGAAVHTNTKDQGVAKEIGSVILGVSVSLLPLVGSFALAQHLGVQSAPSGLGSVFAVGTLLAPVLGAIAVFDNRKSAQAICGISAVTFATMGFLISLI